MMAPHRERRDEVARLFRKHNRVLVRLLQARLGSEQEAQDVAQDAYVRMLQVDRTGAVDHTTAYLFRVARNISTDRLRSLLMARRAALLETFEEHDTTSDPERRAIAAEQVARVDAALAELPEPCRDALLMFRCEELSQQSIASQLGVSERMVRSYVVRASMHCRLRMEESAGAATGQIREVG